MNKKRISKQIVDKFSSLNNKKDYPIDFFEKLVEYDGEIILYLFFI